MNLLRFGKWSTMIKNGTIILDPTKWPGGFMIVLVTSASGDVCNIDEGDEDRCIHDKNSPAELFTINVQSNGTKYETFRASIIVAAGYLLIAVISISLSVVIFNFKYPEFKDFNVQKDGVNLGNVNPQFVDDGTMSEIRIDNSKESDTDRRSDNKRKRKQFSEDDCVSSISTKLRNPVKSKSMYKKSRLYLGTIGLMSIFYSLPVIQMVFRFSYQEKISGNEDICFYNDLCKKPLGVITDFNHIFRKG